MEELSSQTTYVQEQEASEGDEPPDPFPLPVRPRAGSSSPFLNHCSAQRNVDEFVVSVPEITGAVLSPKNGPAIDNPLSFSQGMVVFISTFCF